MNIDKKAIAGGIAAVVGTGIVGYVFLRRKQKAELRTSIPQTAGHSKSANTAFCGNESNVQVVSTGTDKKPARTCEHSTLWDASVISNISVNDRSRLAYDAGRMDSPKKAEKAAALDEIEAVLTFNKIIKNGSTLMDGIALTKKGREVYLTSVATAIMSSGEDAAEFGFTAELKWNYRKKAADIVGKPIVIIRGK